MKTIRHAIETMIGSYATGRIYREGVSLAIVGRPNVGKSSLMNALLERDRVIVTPYAGTTRDTVALHNRTHTKMLVASIQK